MDTTLPWQAARPDLARVSLAELEPSSRFSQALPLALPLLYLDYRAVIASSLTDCIASHITTTANALGCCCCCCCRCCCYFSRVTIHYYLLLPLVFTSHHHHGLLYLGYRQPLHNSSARSSKRDLQHSTAQHYSTLPSSAPRSSPAAHTTATATGHCHTATTPNTPTGSTSQPTSQPHQSYRQSYPSTSLLLCSRRVLHASPPLLVPVPVPGYSPTSSVCVAPVLLHFSCCCCCYCTAACLLSLLPPPRRRRRPSQLLSAPCRRELPFRPPSPSPM
jgi:hypothetical protein